MPPKIIVPFSTRVLVGDSVKGAIFLLSPMPPNIVTASDLMAQLEGTMRVAPPKMAVTSNTAGVVISACVRSISLSPTPYCPLAIRNLVLLKI